MHGELITYGADNRTGRMILLTDAVMVMTNKVPLSDNSQMNRPTDLYKRYRFLAENIQHAVVWLYYRSKLNHRDIEDLLAERGISVS